jgi:DNA polymerase-3 subunit alpha
MLESSIQPKNLVNRVQSLGMPAVAVTDLGNMHGAVDFYLKAKEAGIKPILGCEVFVTIGSRFDKSKPTKKIQYDQNLENKLFRLVLLIKNQEGYKNLCELVTKSYLEGFLNRPRVDYELLEKYSNGLIALTSGLKGEIGYYVCFGKDDLALNTIKKLQNIYKDNLFLEIQDLSLVEQNKLNGFCLEASKKLSIPLVATNETYYLEKKDALSHEVLMCIGAGRTLDEDRGDKRLNPDTYYLKTPQEMFDSFQNISQEALENTLFIAEKCNFEFKTKDEKGKQIYHLPKFDTKEKSTEQALRDLSVEGLKARFEGPEFENLRANSNFNEIKKKYEERLNDELEMIIKTGFAGYFLVVADFIQFAKKNNIPVGPGRGSGAGSLVAYALQITDIDPIQFNLLFERFINPERISMPDFDIDFCQERRSEVINYVIEKYGTEKVAQIATFGKLSAKAVVKDVARVFGIEFSEANQITKLIPDQPGMHINLKEAIDEEPKLKELIEQNQKWKKVFDVAFDLEGLYRQAGMHAAGVIITNQDLTNYCPLFLGKDNITVIQYDKDYAEKIGLVKFDFLGLKTLTVIDQAVKLVQKQNKDFSLKKINYSDPEVYKLISSGDTDGVFQLESSGMKELCKKVMPTNLEDITAINALYRPGPLNSGMVDDYINRKHGRTPVVYELPQLKEILDETYGVIVYQEQVMRIARVLANYTLGEADILRRAMGKKKKEEMDQQRSKFVQGAKQNGIQEELSNKLFDLLAKFAEYGFNKSHSAAYSVLSYQTAYLKRYYPAEFMAAMLATEKDSTEKLTQYISDAKAHGIDVLPPDINYSEKSFSVETLTFPNNTLKKAIRFGLEAIKGVGTIAVDCILEERKKNGKFKNFIDFCERVTLRKVNKKVLESLIASGAFDSLIAESNKKGESLNRASLFESIENVIDHASKVQEQADLGQVSFFDQYKSTSFQIETSDKNLIKRVPEWSDAKKLQMEKSLVGFYVSGHPIERIMPVLKPYVNFNIHGIIEKFNELKENNSHQTQKTFEVKIAAVVVGLREITTKRGSKMAFLEIEDMKDKIECVCFPDVYEKTSLLLQTSMNDCEPLLMSGSINIEETTPKLFLKTVEKCTQFKNKKVSSIVLKLNLKDVNLEKLNILKKIISEHQGDTPVFLDYYGMLNSKQVKCRQILSNEFCVNPTLSLAESINNIFGSDVVKFS